MFKMLFRCLGSSFQQEMNQNSNVDALARIIRRESLIKGCTIAWITVLQALLHVLIAAVIAVLVGAIWILPAPYQFMVYAISSGQDATVAMFFWLLGFVCSEVFAHVVSFFYIHTFVWSWMNIAREQVMEGLAK